MKIPYVGKLATPTAMIVKSSSPVDRDRTVTPMLQQWFVNFAEFLAFHHLKMHCALCRVDIENAKRGFLHWGECAGYKPPLGDTGGATLVKLSTGTLWLGGRPKREELRPEQIEWLRQAADVLPHFQLSIHCAHCEADVAGKNADSDGVYSAACRCTEWIGLNRDAPATTAVN